MTGNIRYFLCYDTVIDRASGARRKGKQLCTEPHNKEFALSLAATMNETWGPDHWIEDEAGERVEEEL